VTALLEEDQARVRVAPALLLSPTNGRLADLRTRALLPFPATYPELRAASYATLIGLLAATGMRIGEAIRLDRSDVDWAEGLLVVAAGKSGICGIRHMRTYVAARTMWPKCASG
jgi:integrase